MLKLSSLTLFVRNLKQASQFYQQGLKLNLISRTEDCILLKAPCVDLFISLQQATQESHLSTGYSPLINFIFKTGIDETIHKLIELGASLDGHIFYDTQGKSATLRAPDGHMIGLYQPEDSL
ncbi:hypothetical protein LOD99_15239 [Oopsacas minuta]|uniref:VOC domain-containing protein n=1 Tax=Oopsacas minuta TaxID=111878 RepID=A0AAV7KBB9_9METZ|nr:hypothetical protein LOD99_15239 [Oopsacas minuta]